MEISLAEINLVRISKIGKPPWSKTLEIAPLAKLDHQGVETFHGKEKKVYYSLIEWVSAYWLFVRVNTVETNAGKCVGHLFIYGQNRSSRSRPGSHNSDDHLYVRSDRDTRIWICTTTLLHCFSTKSMTAKLRCGGTAWVTPWFTFYCGAWGDWLQLNKP